MKDATWVVVILDRSGSMATVRTDAIGGYNTFLAEQKDAPGEATWTLVLFSTAATTIDAQIPVSEARMLTDKTYVPAGNTALLDAVGETIQSVGKKLADMNEADRPNKVLFAILTDGEENSSREFTYEMVSGMIEHQRTVYGWEFIFLAADQDAIAGAQRLSIPAAHAFNYANTSQGNARAFSAVSSATALYRSSGEISLDNWGNPRSQPNQPKTKIDTHKRKS